MSALNKTDLIPFNRPYVGASAIGRVLECLSTGHHSGDGPYTKRVASALSVLLESSAILLMPSCTHALETAIRVLGIGPGHEVVLPSFTFTSTANAVVLAGATPVFVDVDPETLNINPEAVRQVISPRTKAVFCIHYGGVAAPLGQLTRLCSEFGIHLIEDNAHGLDANYRGKPLGSFGALATQSFHETKNLQCGEGGALVVNSPDLLEIAEVFREKGTNRSKFFRGQVDKYSWIDAGSSMLLAEPLAAMLEGQLEHFRETQKRRHKIWTEYDSELGRVCHDRGWKQPTIPDECQHPAHLYYMIVQSLEERQSLLAHLKADRIQATFHYQPLHSSIAGRKYGKVAGELRNTDIAANQLIRLPLWPDMTDNQVHRVIESVQSFAS